MLFIGSVGKRTGTKVQTIRYYEQIGLINTATPMAMAIDFIFDFIFLSIFFRTRGSIKGRRGLSSS